MKSVFFTAILSLVSLFGVSNNPFTHQKLSDLIHKSLNEEDLIVLNYLPQFPLEEYEEVYSPALGRYLVERGSKDMIKQVIREGWQREGHVFNPLRPYITPGSVVIDVGGHIGTHTNGFAQLVGPDGIVHVFEPQLKMFVELVANMELNSRKNVIFHRAALGNEKKMIQMNPSCSSNEGGIAVGTGGDLAPMMRLDDLGLENVSVIKIDAEGMEMEVLQGAIQTIERNRPVMAIEISSDKEFRIKKIEQLGYKAHHLGMDDYLFRPI